MTNSYRGSDIDIKITDDDVLIVSQVVGNEDSVLREEAVTIVDGQDLEVLYNMVGSLLQQEYVAQPTDEEKVSCGC